jgi:hypothetical protein
MVSVLGQEAAAIDPATPVPGNPAQSVPALIISGRQSARPAGTYSAGISEIIAMLDAKVGEQVILAFIQNSSVLYDPDATELIALKEHGASTEVLTALFHHGDELRLRLSQSQNLNAAPVSPAYDETPDQETPAYLYAYPGPDEAQYPTTYYAYAYNWPWLCQTPVCNSYRPYRYEHGSWVGHREAVQVSSEGDHQYLASTALPAAQAPLSVSPTGGGHATAAVTHPTGGHGSTDVHGSAHGRAQAGSPSSGHSR